MQEIQLKKECDYIKINKNLYESLFYNIFIIRKKLIPLKS